MLGDDLALTAQYHLRGSSSRLAHGLRASSEQACVAGVCSLTEYVRDVPLGQWPVLL